MIDTQVDRYNKTSHANKQAELVRAQSVEKQALKPKEVAQQAKDTSTQNDPRQHEKDLAKRLAQGTKQLNEQMESLGTNLRFGFNNDVDQMYVSVTEIDTGKEVRQIPTKEALELIKHFRDAIGLIFDKES